MRAPELETRGAGAPPPARRDSDRTLEPAYANIVHGADMAAVQPISDAEDRRQPHDLIAQVPVELTEVRVLALRRGAAVVARHVGDHHLLARGDTEQLGVHDQVVRVLVVTVVVDVIAHVVKQGGIGERRTFLGSTADALPDRIEEPEREPAYLRRVALFVVASFGELSHRTLAGRARIGDGRRDARELEQQPLTDAIP